MHLPQLSPAQRLYIVIGISFSFFVAEISVGFYTHSLALIADAFHYLNDLVGFVVALAAILISNRGQSPKEFSFQWQRAQVLGAFFNGVFLAALGLSIFLQSLERFISLQRVDNPKLVVIIGAVGLTLNIISILFLHDHDHGHDHGGADGHGHGHDHSDNHAQPELTNDNDIALESTSTHGTPAQNAFEAAGAGVHQHHSHVTSPPSNKKAARDIGLLGVLIHIAGDALNNVGVIVSGLIIWFARTGGRFYADPAISMGISFMILGTSVPLIVNSGRILLESAPVGLDVEEVKRDIALLPGIASVHELHIWRLDQRKAIASIHVVTDYDSLAEFHETAQQIGECLHAYGVHSWTVQPEMASGAELALRVSGSSTLVRSQTDGSAGAVGSGGELKCRIKCETGGCEAPKCCD